LTFFEFETLNMLHRRLLLLSLTWLVFGSFNTVNAQHEHVPGQLVERKPESTRESIHREGLRVNPVGTFAIVGATVHRAPKADPTIETVVVTDGKIVDVGKEPTLPPGTRLVDATGHHLYAGFIDGWMETAVDFDRTKGSGYWNDNIRPQIKVEQGLDFSSIAAKSLRKEGFTAALVAPKDGIIKGQSSLLLMSGEKQHSLLVANVAQHIQLTVSRGRGRGYPNSPMGAYALARQTMYDANWYRDALAVSEANRGTQRPEFNQALRALQPAIGRQQPVVIDSSNELFVLRADRFAREFNLNAYILGNGNEYRRIDEIANLDRPIILPVNFPAAPDVSSPELANSVSLETLMHWDHASSNPAVLEKRGVEFVFTTKGLKSKGDFLKNIRAAVKQGLSKDQALHALTLGVAELYGVEDQVGSVAKNKIANFTLLDGDLFDKGSKVTAVVIDGQHFDFGHHHSRRIEGVWKANKKQLKGFDFVLETKKAKLSGYLRPSKADSQSPAESEGETPAESEGEADAEGGTEASQKMADGDQVSKPEDKNESRIKFKSLKQFGGRVTGTFNHAKMGEEGVCLFTVMFADDETGIGQLTLPNGKVVGFTLKPKDEWAREVTGHKHANQQQDAADGKDTDPAAAADSTGGTNEDKTPAKDHSPSYPVNFPLGAYGVEKPPEIADSVLIKNVTVWTLDERGKIDNGAVLFGNGKIQSVFDLGDAEIDLPKAGKTIDGKGMHVTPGIIDAHSHMATDSGVNESGQAITAEVRIGDMIDPDDMTIYRQIAGGVTAANILHGSANPIGGQNQVIKLRWGANEEQMKLADAPLGIKFALGENVKQSNWSNPSNRYPQTRMGVEQLIDDAIRAGKNYDRRWQAWEKNRVGLPPRRDLELDAMAEIARGQRWVHCHSYRQDEILALIRTLDSHGITIGSFQHILEGYKVADAMAKHGATASAFADWWAYKYEVKDAIPYAGALMHRAGVVVSFNSDDGELGRRLNHEAAKAVRYGGVDEVEALKFVTLNPAKQLRIEERVGSLEPGKDADLVLWSGHPLSTLSRVNQTWIDGRKYFDLREDQKRRKENQTRRNSLIQKVLTSGQKMEAGSKETIDPAKLWPRYDEFCGHHQHQDDNKLNNNETRSNNE
jgi:N-acetylglucosamine-6-phosphate deacetylase